MANKPLNQLSYPSLIAYLLGGAAKPALANILVMAHPSTSISRLSRQNAMRDEGKTYFLEAIPYSVDFIVFIASLRIHLGGGIKTYLHETP